MTLNVVQVSLTAARVAGNFETFRFNLGEPYIRWISARTNAPAATVSFRLTHQNQVFAPVPGIGKVDWILMLSSVDWDEFRKLTGPNYEFILEAFNTDAQSAYILQLLMETSKTPNYPVSVLNDPEFPAHKQPSTGTSGT